MSSFFNHWRSALEELVKKSNDQNVAGTSNDLFSSAEDETEFYLIKKLSDKGKFCYAGMCAITLKNLFYSDYPVFCDKTLTTVLCHLSVSPEVEETAHSFIHEESVTDPLIFVNVLKKEICSIKKDNKVIIQDLIFLALHEAEYDARWRVFIKQIGKYMDLKEDIELFEISVSDFIIKGAKEIPLDEKLRLQKRKKIAVVKRCAIVSLAAVGGGLAVGATGGLAAPALVGFLAEVAGSTAFGASVVTALSTVGGTALIASLFGSIGASLTAYKMNKRVGDIKEFEFGHLRKNSVESFASVSTSGSIPDIEISHLSATIAISGWIVTLEENNFALPWTKLLISRDQYYLKYESSHLLELGKLLQNTLLEIPKVLLGGGSALFKRATLPTAVLSLISIIDIPWSVCCSKAVLVGKQLAEVLLSRNHGRKPISLIGYSIGARVIYYCLLELSERQKSEGIIEDVYLIGAPCPADPVVWEKFMKVVSGTLTNAYSKSDMVLKVLYILLSLPDGGAAGIKPIDVSHKRLRNVDLTEIITSHKDYPEKLTQVLKKLNICET